MLADGVVHLDPAGRSAPSDLSAHRERSSRIWRRRLGSEFRRTSWPSMAPPLFEPTSLPERATALTSAAPRFTRQRQMGTRTAEPERATSSLDLPGADYGWLRFQYGHGGVAADQGHHRRTPPDAAGKLGRPLQALLRRHFEPETHTSV